MTETDTVRAALVKADELEALLDDIEFRRPRGVYSALEIDRDN